MIPRKIKTQLRSRLEDYPAVVLIGPRQCGKTTLARSFKGRYYDLEQETDRLRLDLEWEDVASGSQLVILDEAQSWPDIFPRLRGAIDNDRTRNRRFLLLGSVSPLLMTKVAESLAGRLSIIELTPLLWCELKSKAAKQRHWLLGGYPDGGVLNIKRFPLWQRDYLSLLTQRDFPNWGLTARAQVTDRLLQMLAATNGQEWNASQLGKSLALTYHTVNSYLDFLEGAFLIRRLPAYHANIRKRLVKRPKVYWRDSGLLHAMLNVQDQKSLFNQPWIGASWEGYVINQIIAALQVQNRLFKAYYLRTSDQHEIDLLIEIESELWAFEVKLTTRPSPGDMARLDATADLVGADKRFLVCQRSDMIRTKKQMVCDLEGIMGFIGL